MKIENIKTIVNPILKSKDLYLVDLKISKDNVIELFIDSFQGVKLQTCIEISRELETHLNREEEDFELTVSSAGIGYPFKVKEQFQKNLSKSVEAKLKDNTKVSGILKCFDDQTITLEYEEKQLVEGSKKKQLVKIEKTIFLEEIKEIRDIVVF